MPPVKQQPCPFAPLVFDDEEAIEELSSVVLQLHDALSTNGRCFTTGTTEEKAAATRGRIESVLLNAFCTIFGQSPFERFLDIFDQASYVAEHMAKDHIFEDGNKRTSLVFALSILALRNVPVVFPDNPDPESNPYYAWIQDLVSGKRTREELAQELRSNHISK